MAIGAPDDDEAVTADLAVPWNNCTESCDDYHSPFFFRFGNAPSIHYVNSSGVISPREQASRFCMASYRQRLKSASLICRTLTRAEYLL